MRRRRFLAALLLSPAAAAGCRPGQKAPPEGAAPSPPPPQDGCETALRDARSGRMLSPAEWDALEAACERILPRDGDAGARDAGVINYIDAQLAAPPVASLRGLLQAGARELDRQAAARGGRRFSALGAAEQDQVLGALQRGRLESGQAGARFFQVLLVLTLEGFLGDPVYGGNWGGVGWRLVGHEPRSPRPRCAHRGAG